MAAGIRAAGTVENTAGAVLKLIVLPVLDEITVVRASSVALTRVPRNTSHCAPASAQNHPVSPSLVSPEATVTKPVTAPVSVRFPVPVVLVVSLQRSMTLWAMPTPYIA